MLYFVTSHVLPNGGASLRRDLAAVVGVAKEVVKGYNKQRSG